MLSFLELFYCDEKLEFNTDRGNKYINHKSNISAEQYANSNRKFNMINGLIQHLLEVKNMTTVKEIYSSFLKEIKQ